MCNFIEGGLSSWGSDVKLIYQRYLELYFVFVVDETESELSILDLIDVFLETLRRSFKNLSELDLQFHVEKVHFILDEFIQGGMVLETVDERIYRAIKDQKEIVNKENPIKETIKEVKESKLFH